jgi:glutathione synthase/RimK-type ligase-like ATP-grasp enzyme
VSAAERPTRVALVTAREALPLDQDLPPLVAALTDSGAEVSTPCWDDPAVNWRQFDLAVLRSTWDYVDRIGEFLAWSERCALQTRLVNPPEVVRWNTDKHYLSHLANRGVPVVPTTFVEPGTQPVTALEAFLVRGDAAMSAGVPAPFGEFVVKPAVGAGSKDTARYRRTERARALAHLESLLSARRSAMLQPYLDAVDAHGETAVVYLGGRFSHAIRKGPLLALDAGLVEGLFAPEDITPREPEPAEHAVAAAAYRALPFEAPVYARIDLVRDARGAPLVLELELTEPSLFFTHAPLSARRFADALLALPSAVAGTG